MLLDKRLIYAPFEYQQAYDFWESQQQAHWLHTEISMASDIQDWKNNLSDSERFLIGSVLKGFTQAEIFIEDYWSNKVANWFKKPEIQMMANTFASFETIHAVSYAYLNQSLNIEDYEAFLYEPTAKAKIDRLMTAKSKSIYDKALSLAIFSAFNEGVNLFASFAILLNFSRFNKLKGVGQIIAFSVRDESLHSKAGCWLFNQLLLEYPEIRTSEFCEEIYEAAKVTVRLEEDFIDKCFESGNPEGLDKVDLKNYIRFRTNTKLNDIGFDSIFTQDNQSLERLAWFDVLTSGVEHADFFSSRVTSYSKGTKNWDNIWN